MKKGTNCSWSSSRIEDLSVEFRYLKDIFSQFFCLCRLSAVAQTGQTMSTPHEYTFETSEAEWPPKNGPQISSRHPPFYVPILQLSWREMKKGTNCSWSSSRMENLLVEFRYLKDIFSQFFCLCASFSCRPDWPNNEHPSWRYLPDVEGKRGTSKLSPNIYETPLILLDILQTSRGSVEKGSRCSLSLSRLLGPPGETSYQQVVLKKK